MNTIKIVISPKSVIIAITFLILTLVIYKIKDVILLLFASFVIACSLYPVVDWISKKIPRGIAVTIIYLLGLILISTVLVPFTIILVDQIREFIGNLPLYWQTINKLSSSWQVNTNDYRILPRFFSQILSGASFIGQRVISQSIDITLAFFTGIIAAFTLAVLVFFLLLDKDELKNGFIKLFPEHTRKKTEVILKTISLKVGGYVRGQLLLIFAVSLLTTLGLHLIGVRYALLLGILAGLLEIIPIIGPILSAIPGVFVALAQDPWLALWAILIYLIVQRIENSFLTPYILGRFLDMHPLIILIALLTAASTIGVIGVILSPAIAAAIYVLIQELYLNRINNDKET